MKLIVQVTHRQHNDDDGADVLEHYTHHPGVSACYLEIITKASGNIRIVTDIFSAFSCIGEIFETRFLSGN